MRAHRKRARPRPHLLRQPRLRLLRRRPLPAQRGGNRQPRDGPAPGRALRGDRRSPSAPARRRRPRRPPDPHPLPHRRPPRPSSAASARSRSSAPRTASARPTTTPPRTRPTNVDDDAIDAGGRVHARAGAGDRPRRLRAPDPTGASPASATSRPPGPAIGYKPPGERRSGATGRESCSGAPPRRGSSARGWPSTGAGSPPSAACASTTTPRSGSGRSTTSRPSGARSGTTSRCARTSPATPRPRLARDARRGVVPGHAPQLRRARLPRPRRLRRRDPPRLGAARPGRAELGRAALPGRRGGRRPARSRGRAAATASSPTCPTSRRRSSPSSPPPRSARSGPAAHPTSAPRSVVDRFAQIEPKVLLAVDGYRYGGKDFDRPTVVAGLQARDAEPRADRGPPLPRPRPRPLSAARRDRLGRARWRRAQGAELDLRAGPLRPPALGPLLIRHHRPAEGDRPGPGRDPPRAPEEAQPPRRPPPRRPHLLVHDHRLDDVELPRLRPAHPTPRSSLYDGNPGHPDMGVLWDLAERAGITCFGTSASYIAACMKDGVEPGAGRDLSRLRAVGSTGSPLSPEGFDWIYEHVGSDTWLFSTSGGTDLCTAFVGGVATAARLPRRAPGAARSAPRSRPGTRTATPLVGEVGELVVTEPMPSMPVFFWGDATAAATAPPTSSTTPASGATATGSRSPPAAPR